jgi:hypothetical protein
MAQIIFIGLLIAFGAALVAALSRPQPQPPQVIYYISGDPPPPQPSGGASFLLLMLFIALAIALF